MLEEKKDIYEQSEEWYRIAKKIIAVLWKVKGAFIYHSPVDQTAYGISDYYDYIKTPMDFGTIKVPIHPLSDLKDET